MAGQAELALPQLREMHNAADTRFDDPVKSIGNQRLEDQTSGASSHIYRP